MESKENKNEIIISNFANKDNFFSKSLQQENIAKKIFEELGGSINKNTFEKHIKKPK